MVAQHYGRFLAQDKVALAARMQFMRDNWPSNRIFTTYDDIVTHCCEAWNRLIDQPWRIVSIAARDSARQY